MTIHQRHTNNTRTPLYAVLKQPNEFGVDTVINLTGLTVTFTMINMATNTVELAPTSTGVTVETAASGTVKFDFSLANIDTAGKYIGYFIVTDAGESDNFPVAAGGLIIVIDSDTITGEDAYNTALAAQQALDALIPGTISDFPETIIIGDSYTDQNGRSVEIPIVDTDGIATAVSGSLNFADAVITFDIKRAGETDTTKIISGSVVFTDVAGTADSPYVTIELLSSETSKGLTGYKYTGLLTFTWAYAGTGSENEVVSFKTDTILFIT